MAEQKNTQPSTDTSDATKTSKPVELNPEVLEQRIAPGTLVPGGN